MIYEGHCANHKSYLFSKAIDGNLFSSEGLKKFQMKT